MKKVNENGNHRIIMTSSCYWILYSWVIERLINELTGYNKEKSNHNNVDRFSTTTPIDEKPIECQIQLNIFSTFFYRLLEKTLDHIHYSIS